jgi:hypothetical protein
VTPEPLVFAPRPRDLTFIFVRLRVRVRVHVLVLVPVLVHVLGQHPPPLARLVSPRPLSPSFS